MTENSTMDPKTMQITNEGAKYLMAEIDLLNDEIKVLKNQLEGERERYKEATYKLKALLFELEVLK